VTTLVSVVGLNFLLGEFLRRYTTNLGYYLIAKKWDLLEVQEEPVDWLILGDSSCNQGVRPDVFIRERDETALNLCTTAQQLVLEGTWQLERYLQRVGPPRKGVIVVHVYDIWPTGASGLGGMGYRPPIHQGLSLVPLYWGFWRDYHPAVELTRSQERELGLLRFVPAYGQSGTVRRWFFSPRWSRRVLERRQIDDRGYMRVDRGREEATGQDTSAHVAYLRRQEAFNVSPLNEAAFKTMVDLTAEHELRLYLALSPLHEGLAEHRRFRRHLRRARAGLKALCGLGSHVHCILMDDPASFPADGMENSDHVTHPLAETYTRRLLEAMKEAE
jgi:hypothetical protein